MVDTKKENKSTAKEAKTKTVTETKPRRKPYKRRGTLTVPDHIKKPGFVYRFVNEDIGQIEAREEGGWKVVLSRKQESETQRVQDRAPQGTPYRVVVNKDKNASANTAVLMEIPEEFYLEDKAEANKINDEIENSYDPDAVKKSNPGFYGFSKDE